MLFCNKGRPVEEQQGEHCGGGRSWVQSQVAVLCSVHTNTKHIPEYIQHRTRIYTADSNDLKVPISFSSTLFA